MNLATIDMPVEEAKERLAEYEAALRAERNVEDEALAAAYRAASRGLPIIRLTEAFERGGRFDSGLPRLAIVRADANECFVDVSAGWGGRPDSLVFSADRRRDNRGALVGWYTVRVAVPAAPHRFTGRGQTVVPLIPPRHRPRRGRIGSFHVLWEVEEWSPMPPVDPALLRHIRGDLWAVVATWDLTELERAVLSARVS